MTHLTATETSANAAVLTHAAATFRAALNGDRQKRLDAETVVNALLAQEKATKQNRTTIPPEALQGTWRLCFTTGVRKLRRGGIALGKGFYMPVLLPAHIGFEAMEGDASPTRITNQIQLGGLRIQFTGPCRYQAKKNLLAFDFTELQVTLFEKTLYQGKIRSGKSAVPFNQQPIAKLPFFAFFWITPDGVAARGRGGGLALWVRVG